MLALTAASLSVLAACGRIGFEPRAGQDARMEDGDPPTTEWSLVQVVSASSTGEVTISPSRAGSLLVVASEFGRDSIVAVTDDARNVYTAIPEAAAVDIGTIECWYVAGAAGGARVITITTAGGMLPVGAVVWEVANIRSSNALDAARALSRQPMTLEPVSPEITTATAGDFVVAVVKFQHVVTGISAGNEFTSDSLVARDGWAHLTDPRAPAGPYQARWTGDTSGTFCSFAVAFFPGP